MGIIQRQATKSSIISWAGLLLGIFNILFVVPYALEMYGIFMFITGIVLMVSPVISMGMQLGVVKFFNEYDDGAKSNRSLLSFGVVTTFIGFAFFCFIIFLFKDPIIDYYQSKEPERYQYLIFVFPLIILVALFNVIEKYITNFKRIVIPTIIKNIVKIVLPILLIAYWKDKIDAWGFLNWFVLFNVALLVILLLYLKQLKEFDFRWSKKIINRANLVEMRAYMLNGMLLSLGSVIAGLIDSFMVGSMIDMGQSTAIYSIGAVISGILMMPNTAIGGIANPIISQGWKDKDLSGLQSIYQKSSITLFLVGMLLFAGIWVGIDDVFSIMHNGDVISEAKGVILFLGIARLFSMACGINGNVLYLSPSFKVGTYAILFLAVLNVVNNYYFISKYGLVGAAMGTAVSVGLYNTFLSGFLMIKYKLQPFTLRLVYILIFALLSIFIALNIDVGNAYGNIIIRGATVFVIYVSAVYFTKQSEDINNLINHGFKTAKGLIRKS